MPRIAPLDYSNLTDEQQWAVQRFKEGKIGAVRGPAEIWLRSPALADLERQMVEFVRYDSTLPRDVIELVLLLTGAHWKAQVEFWGHSRMALHAGIPAGVIEAIRTGQRPALERPEMAAAYELVSEYFATNRVSKATYGRAVEILGERAIVEIIGACGLYGLVSMTLNVFEATVPEGEENPFPE